MRIVNHLKIRIGILLLLSCLIPLQGVASRHSINSALIIKDTTEAAYKNLFGNFLNYKVVGICFWLQFQYIKPHIKKTLKVSEFLPDAVVTVYTGYKHNPWVYANHIVDPVMHQAGSMQVKAITGLTPESGTTSAGGGNDMMQKFKEVDVIGNPALLTFTNSIPLSLIPSKAHAFLPYYSSLLDAVLWHNATLEEAMYPEYLLPGVRVVGHFLTSWGSVFPRTGRINQYGDFKAAGVIALRGLDIATHRHQSHLYNPLYSGSCGHDCRVWPSHENDFSNVKFQEIYPKETNDAKKLFGVTGITGDFHQSDYAKGKGSYVFILWRHYRGCLQAKGMFLGSV